MRTTVLHKLEYEVVVVGAGSAGCALAAELIGKGVSVCLVEAGPDYGPHTSSRWPAELLDPHIRPVTHEWEIEGAEVAKVMGGCSTHNQCAAVWGQPEDYDAWAALGNEGWSARDLEPLRKRVEDTAASAPYPEEQLACWQRAFLEGATSAGYRRLNDVSQKGGEGVGAFHATVKDGIRWNAAFAFLDPVRSGRQLTLLDGLLADRLQIERDRALTLFCRRGREQVELKADKFVLSAGTLGSPVILMRSGVGEKSQLKRYKIPQVLDRPGVGENLHDHPGIGLRFEPGDLAQKELASDISNRRFYQSQVVLRARSKVGAKGKAGKNRAAADSFDLHILPYQSLRGFEATYGLLAFGMAPLSRGRLQLGGRDPHRKPKVDFAFLSDPEHHDLEVLVEAIPIIRRLARQPPLAKLVASEREPGARTTAAGSLRSFVSRTVNGYLHPVGTCKMGPASDEMAVVDASGKVHGLENVFVADASIMPVIPRANTSLTAMLIGVKIAQSISA